jgi:Glycosyltransferases involved in cell wall biogenesis
MKKVSVVVPVYGVEKYLRKCLDSLVNQTLEDIEIIIINDGTKDNSQEIIDEFKNEYPNKIISIIKENEGLSIARNVGTNIATGEYLIYIDSDDCVDLSMLEKMYNKAIDKKPDIVICDYYEVCEEDGNKKYCQGISEEISDDINKSFVISSARAWGKLIKRSYLKRTKLKFLENRVYEDIATVPAYIMFNPSILHVPEPLYYYLIREGSIMKQPVYNKRLEDIFFSMDNIKFLFEKNKKIKNYREEIEFLYIYHLLHGATLRFIKFDNYKDNVDKIIQIMKEQFPNWEKNKYYKRQSTKYRIICRLIMLNQIRMIKLLIKG